MSRFWARPGMTQKEWDDLVAQLSPELKAFLGLIDDDEYIDQTGGVFCEHRDPEERRIAEAIYRRFMERKARRQGQ